MLIFVGVVASPFIVSGCTTSKLADGMTTSSVRSSSYAYSAKDKECLARAMFFESNRSSRDGLVAVGSVVMNRLKSGEYGDSVCGVVGQKGQFAPGVLSRPMNSQALPDVQAAAESVLKGERHPKVKPEVMFFHTAGLKFPYKNMHYTTVAGGNAFYEKRSRRKLPAVMEPETMVASAEQPTLPGVVEQQPATVASVGSDAALASAMSFQATPEDADAIGALIVSQDRPM
ncbi:spore germination cell wall hydrolase CwlJ-like protein [Aminobacter lissarensis]|uniref:Spore germination cell wall hydrolase CwlJ-like protein n=1 Tax=Aminobacter carboxidus TaxID=376165 RepID=A0A8E1WL75_9HYPH|nr:cell wall hydrolase [Aminobacter lissarensis]MBB6469714.1 spore germination cell wall hydrolase CwlJ-like protein [Aminobacter lissarensis]